MNDHYTNSSPGEQNIAQGENAIGKQKNFFYRLLGRIFTTGNQSHRRLGLAAMCRP
jgi:hypothetical protein